MKGGGKKRQSEREEVRKRGGEGEGVNKNRRKENSGRKGVRANSENRK